MSTLPTRVILPDGTSWPATAASANLAWKLRYASDTLTGEECLTIADIVEVYIELVTTPTAAKKLPQIRRAEAKQKETTP